MEFVEGQILETAVSVEVDMRYPSPLLPFGGFSTKSFRGPCLGRSRNESEIPNSSVRHHFFKDNRAPLAFANARALQGIRQQGMLTAFAARSEPLLLYILQIIIYFFSTGLDRIEGARTL